MSKFKMKTLDQDTEFTSPLTKQEHIENMERIIQQVDPGEGLTLAENSARLTMAATIATFIVEQSIQAREETIRLSPSNSNKDALKQYVALGITGKVAHIIDMYAKGEFIIE